MFSYTRADEIESGAKAILQCFWFTGDELEKQFTNTYLEYKRVFDSYVILRDELRRNRKTAAGAVGSFDEYKSLIEQMLIRTLNELKKSLQTHIDSKGTEWDLIPILPQLKEFYGFPSENYEPSTHIEPASVSFSRELIQNVERLLVVIKRELKSESLHVHIPSEGTLKIGKTVAVGNNAKPNEKTERIARRAITIFEGIIENIVQREKGKRHPLSNNDIVNEAIRKYFDLAEAQRFAQTERGLTRYLYHIGKEITIRKYGGHLVRQLKQGNSI